MNQNNQIIINNQNNMDIEFVIPGHYCSKATLNDEVKSIIRVLGPDNKRKGYWKIDSGKSLSENIILDDYVLLDTQPTETNKNNVKNIMRDFKPTVGNHQNTIENEDDEYIGYDDKAPYSREIPKHLIPDTVEQVKVNVKPLAEKIKQLTDINSIDNILRKATVNQLNDNYEKKYGTRPYKTTKITIPVTIEIPYVLDKLSQICELFELSLDEVAESIFNDLTLPEELIISKITEALMPKTFKEPQDTNQPQLENNPQHVNQPKLDTIQEIKTNEQQKQLESGINEVEDYLKNLFN